MNPEDTNNPRLEFASKTDAVKNRAEKTKAKNGR